MVPSIFFAALPGTPCLRASIALACAIKSGSNPEIVPAPVAVADGAVAVLVDRLVCCAAWANHGHPSVSNRLAPSQGILLCSAIFLWATKFIRSPASINTRRPTIINFNILGSVICQLRYIHAHKNMVKFELTAWVISASVD